MKKDSYVIAEIAHTLKLASEVVKEGLVTGDEDVHTLIAREIYDPLSSLLGSDYSKDLEEKFNRTLNEKIELENNLDQAVSANHKLHEDLIKKNNQVDKLIDLLLVLNRESNTNS